MEGQIEAKVDESGELTYNKHHNIEDEVQELMAKWLKKTRRNDCEQSRKGDEKMTREIDYESSKRMNHQLRVDKKIKASFRSKDTRKTILQTRWRRHIELHRGSKQRRESETQQQHRKEDTRKDHEKVRRKKIPQQTRTPTSNKMQRKRAAAAKGYPRR